MVFGEKPAGGGREGRGQETEEIQRDRDLETPGKQQGLEGKKADLEKQSRDPEEEQEGGGHRRKDGPSEDRKKTQGAEDLHGRAGFGAPQTWSRAHPEAGWLCDLGPMP